jgi:putative spermidine/putrescine transport system substrate-binding protein
MSIKKTLSLVVAVVLCLAVFSTFAEDSKVYKPDVFPVSSPVALSIIDVAGNAQLTQEAMEEFVKLYPETIKEIEIMRLTAPELAAKLQAQQDANNIDTALVMTGFDGIAACVDADVIEHLWPQYGDLFPGLIDRYLAGAKASFDVVDGYGLPNVFCPGGPMFSYDPSKVTEVPKTAEDLLEWCKENPGKFMYARPANSGPGRALLMGLPYILGDEDPKDPETWDKTWAYLKELDQYIDYYPTGTGVTFRELGEGTRWMLASHLGWDMNQRILGTIPENFQAFQLENSTFIADTQFSVLPKGLSDDQRNAALAMIDWIMTPEMQAYTYDSGYFFPGPAIEGITMDMAPTEMREKNEAAYREYFGEWIANSPTTTQLDPAAMVKANDMWDQLVGAKIQ